MFPEQGTQIMFARLRSLLKTGIDCKDNVPACRNGNVVNSAANEIPN